MADYSLNAMTAFLILLANLVLVLGTEHVPVFMWEAKGGVGKPADLPSLAKVTSDEFSNFLMKKSDKKGPRPLIAVFVEENLSVEDFSWQDKEGHNAFPHLQNVTSASKNVYFFPSVHAPLKALKRLGYQWQSIQIDQDLPMHPKADEILVINMDDARIDEDRPDLLKRHDQIISELYNELRDKSKDVIALYTSHHSSWVEPSYEPLTRRIRSIPEVDKDPFVLWNDSIMFYSTVTPIFYPDLAESKSINITTDKCKKDIRPGFESLKCQFDENNYSLEFRFITSETKYWNLSIYITDFYNSNTSGPTLLSSSSEIYAPVGFSYHCSQQVVFKSTSMKLILENFQIQPNVTDGFDDAYDCVWFFTVPIWTGLLVTLLLGIILMMGIVAIMDINTMDRFDDPKGKPVMINTSE